MQIQVECTIGWLLPKDSFGDEKSNRKRLGPGVRCTRVLKCDAVTGQLIEGKLSWWWNTVMLPSSG